MLGRDRSSSARKLSSLSNDRMSNRIIAVENMRKFMVYSKTIMSSTTYKKKNPWGNQFTKASSIEHRKRRTKIEEINRREPLNGVERRRKEHQQCKNSIANVIDKVRDTWEKLRKWRRCFCFLCSSIILVLSELRSRREKVFLFYFTSASF